MGAKRKKRWKKTSIGSQDSTTAVAPHEETSKSTRQARSPRNFLKLRSTLAEWRLPSPAVSQKFAVGRFRCFGSDFSLIPRHLHGSRSSFRSLLLASSSSSCFSFVLLTCFCPCFTPWCSSIGFPFPFGSLQGALWFVLQSLYLCSSILLQKGHYLPCTRCFLHSLQQLLCQLWALRRVVTRLGTDATGGLRFGAFASTADFFHCMRFGLPKGRLSHWDDTRTCQTSLKAVGL